MSVTQLLEGRSVKERVRQRLRRSLLSVVGAATVAALSSSVWAAEDIVPFGSDWTYLVPQGFDDDPSIRDADFDTTWFTDAFNDARWDGPSPAPLAYGGVDGYNPPATDLMDPGTAERYSAYFRHEFSTTQGFDNLGIEFLVDDGAVFYLDGQEIFRHNCCVDQGLASDDIFLAHANNTDSESTYRTRSVLDGQTLSTGNHLLAVSVHQQSVTSSDLGFEMRFLSQDPPPPPDPNKTIITTGIDTTLAEFGQMGPSAPHGTLTEWEWDGEDGGGENHGLIWFDVPADALSSFDGKATLLLNVTNEGSSGDVYRMTEDWLSGRDGGDEVTWDNIPGGPGIFPGDNTTRNPSFSTGDVTAGTAIEFDVTDDVLAWMGGEPNYGWGFVPTGTNGVGIASFETFDEAPQLVLEKADAGVALQAGDANQDLEFDQVDLVQVQIAAKYLTGEAATWGQGDWDAAPGGQVGSPPQGDGLFNQRDIVAAQIAGLYLQGSYGALAGLAPGNGETDEQTSIVYNPGTGEVSVNAPASTELTSINIDSATSIFTGDVALNLGGSFDNDADNNIFKATFGSSFGSLSFGNVAQPGLSADQVLNDLTVIGSLAGGGDLGAVDLIYVPEPSALVLLAVGLAGLIAMGRRRMA